MAFVLWGAVVAGAGEIAMILAVVLVFSVVFTVGLSAAGGYLGVAVGEDGGP